MAPNDTIAAIATAPGRSGIGVIRLSGPRGALDAIIKQIVNKTLFPRRAVLAEFLEPSGAVIDQGLALYFPGPQSYTGEDVLELQGHGGPVVLQLLLKRCLDLGARIAEPGEFTKRAFLNDKLDLAQAEGVVDLIEATTAAAARCAVRSLQGDFSKCIHELTDDLVGLRTRVEAALDFPDEDIDVLPQSEIHDAVRDLRQRLEAVLEASQQGSLLREGIHVVLAGQPNVGKSSLLNRLAGEDLAIVTDIPGTTRDAIRQTIAIGGLPVHVIDTAGLRDAKDPVEAIGIARTWTAIEKADLVVLLLDATLGISQEDQAILARLPQRLARLHVMNKIDLVGEAARVEGGDNATVIWLSAKTGAGIDLLRESLLKTAGWHGTGESTYLARARHLQALRTARDHLDRSAEAELRLELMAEELRLAQQSLSTITGEFTADDLLGEIFSRFCIGK